MPTYTKMLTQECTAYMREGHHAWTDYWAHPSCDGATHLLLPCTLDAACLLTQLSMSGATHPTFPHPFRRSDRHDTMLLTHGRSHARTPSGPR